MSKFEMRMADRIVKRGQYIRFPHETDAICPRTVQSEHDDIRDFATSNATTSIRIVMDDVRLAFHSDYSRSERWHWMDHAQRAIPPYQKLWAEFITAKENYIGAIITVVKRGDPAFARITEHPFDECSWMVAYHIYYCLHFLTQSSDRLVYEWGLDGMCEAQYDSVGRFLNGTMAITPHMKDRMDVFNSFALTFAHGLSLMNHKSYEARKIKTHGGIRKKIEQEYGTPLLSYRQLWVNCLDSMKSGVMPKSGEFRDVREHFVRGHFKYYTEEKPLFGRQGQHGWFWQDYHVRGNKERGTVVKDYAIATG